MSRTIHHRDRRDPLAKSPKRPTTRRTSTRAAAIRAALSEG